MFKQLGKRRDLKDAINKLVRKEMLDCCPKSWPLVGLSEKSRTHEANFKPMGLGYMMMLMMTIMTEVKKNLKLDNAVKNSLEFQDVINLNTTSTFYQTNVGV